eukprot:TRINITY_DN33050_c0_g1_i1.p1 TRINITY_DN33050_c0_g1~~TRINITY_DN33050_c0_g1_i1.p1  ORF type:complete len:125 (+),score=26.93 TRINITY_DN33050_c0_g1_i1:46-420(+)
MLLDKQVTGNIEFDPVSQNSTNNGLMDQDFSLFDPFSETKQVDTALIEKSEEVINKVIKNPSDDKVIIEDLLGGFSEVVRSDQIYSKEEDRKASTATSFFLLDFDNGGADDPSTARNNDFRYRQ